MNKEKLFPALIALVVIAAVIPSALAVPKYYELGNGSSVSAFSGPEPPGGGGLVIQTMVEPGVAGTNFTLDDGQTYSFELFDIWTNETYVNSDDTVPRQITATLDFAVPSSDPTITGDTVGTGIFCGIIQFGQVSWNGPATVVLSGDRTFQVSLSDEIFNIGLFGLSDGPCWGADVKACITQIDSVVVAQETVPDTGNSALLLGVAVVAIGLMAGRTRFPR